VDELGCTIGEELLRVHRSYLPALRPLLDAGLVKGLAHITGGGITENLPRILPPAPDFVDLHDAKILIADDVADTGHTLLSVEAFCGGKVREVRTAVLYEKSRSLVKCDYVWRRTDRWIDFPWSDRDPVVPEPALRTSA